MMDDIKTLKYYFDNSIIGKLGEAKIKKDRWDNWKSTYYNNISFYYKGREIFIEPCNYDKYIVKSVEFCSSICFNVKSNLNNDSKFILSKGCLIDVYDELETVIIPNSCTNILDGAFHSDKLKSVTLSKNCKVHSGAFIAPNLEYIKVISDETYLDDPNVFGNAVIDITEINHVLFMYRNFFNRNNYKFKPTILVRNGSEQFIQLSKEIFGNEIRIKEKV